MNVTTELIKVTGVSPYSVYSGQQRYSFNKNVNSTMFTKGNTYSINMKVGPKGAKYIDSVSNDLGVLAGDATPVATSATGTLDANINVRSSFQKKDDGMSKAEWAAKDKRISRSGVIQAAVVAVAPHSQSVEDLQAKAFILANAMLEYVNRSTEVVA